MIIATKGGRRCARAVVDTDDLCTSDTAARGRPRKNPTIRVPPPPLRARRPLVAEKSQISLAGRCAPLDKDATAESGSFCFAFCLSDNALLSSFRPHRWRPGDLVGCGGGGRTQALLAVGGGWPTTAKTREFRCQRPHDARINPRLSSRCPASDPIHRVYSIFFLCAHRRRCRGRKEKKPGQRTGAFFVCTQRVNGRIDFFAPRPSSTGCKKKESKTRASGIVFGGCGCGLFFVYFRHGTDLFDWSCRVQWCTIV